MQFHEELGLPFPGVTDAAAPEEPAGEDPAVGGVEVPEGDDPDAVVPEGEDPEGTAAEDEPAVETPPEPPPEEPEVVEPPEVTTGKLMITSDRRAAVFIDKKKIGITPLEAPLDLEAGTYEVLAVALKTGKNQRLQARVDAGKVLQVAFEFR